MNIFDINSIDDNDYSALTHAINCKNTKIMDKLIKLKADISDNDVNLPFLV